MAKDLYEENKELKRVLYNIEKAILDFRLTQLDLPLEKVNIPSLGLPRPQTQTVPYTITTCSCTDGEGCNCDEEKEVLREQIAALTAKLNGANAELEQYRRKEVPEDVAPTGFPGDSATDEEDEVIYENGFATYVEPEPAPPREEEKKTRKPRKERGGTVFTDFKNLELENNDYEGNSIVYSKKDM
jgi:hypothetical protein